MKNKLFFTGILSIALMSCATNSGGTISVGDSDNELFAVWYFDTNGNGIVDRDEAIAYEFKSDGKLLKGGQYRDDTFSFSEDQITWRMPGGYTAPTSITFTINGNSLTLTGLTSSGFKPGKYAKK